MADDKDPERPEDETPPPQRPVAGEPGAPDAPAQDAVPEADPQPAEIPAPAPVADEVIAEAAAEIEAEVTQEAEIAEAEAAPPPEPAEPEEIFEAEAEAVAPPPPADPEPPLPSPPDEFGIYAEAEAPAEDAPIEPEEPLIEAVEVQPEPEPGPEPEPEPTFEADTEAEQYAEPVQAESEPETELEAEPAFEPEPEPEPEYEAPPLAARDATPADPAPPPEPQRDAAPLPPGYFRAAGDPDDPVEPAPQSFFERLGANVQARLNSAWAWTEPKLVAFSGTMRAFFGEVWARMSNVRRPRNLREVAVWGGWAAGGFVALIVGFFFFVTWGMPSTDDLWEARQGQSITFLDRNGHVILREGAQNAPPVDMSTLPPYVAQAFLAIEDRRFYSHHGVDFSGMMRAGAENLRAGRVVQGGSTITQQLAKNLFLTNERSWRRKAQEIAMAFWLESRFSKDEILALYLSRVYFGAGAYGIEAAAERYFDRPARELTLLQSAMLAGLVKAPSRLNPARQDIAAARERAELVLAEMVAMGYISDAERQAAMQEELVISRRNPAGILGYYRDWVDPLLQEVIGAQRDDFIIETTLDINAQRAGAESVEQVLAEQGEARRVGQAALLALDETGGVRAMVGGRDYDQSQFNRTWQARRQPGSSFKFFIYLAAMENGLTPSSIRNDAPVTIGDWTPANYTEEFRGPVSLATAFMHSYNMVAIRVAHEVGHERVIDVARRLGVRSPLHDYRSLALGAQEITMLEMTQAYGAMANGGRRMYAHGIVRIRRANNNEVMWSWRPPTNERVIEDRPLRFMNAMMVRTVEAGTGTAARVPGRQIGGKTGTGNDYRDAWFIGFTPGYVAAVWVGNDNFTVTGRVTGGSLPAEIWGRFSRVALEGVPNRPIAMPTPEDLAQEGAPDPEALQSLVVGAPVGAVIGAPAPAPEDNQDRSLDFGPEG